MQVLVIGVLSFVMLGILSVLNGTILFLMWKVAIPAFLPGLVASGIIAAKLTWWQSVCLSWVMAILFGKTNTVNVKK